jgi:hypothetical protein
MLIKIGAAGFAFGQHLAKQEDVRTPSVEVVQ